MPLLPMQRPGTPPESVVVVVLLRLRWPPSLLRLEPGPTHLLTIIPNRRERTLINEMEGQGDTRLRLYERRGEKRRRARVP